MSQTVLIAVAAFMVIFAVHSSLSLESSHPCSVVQECKNTTRWASVLASRREYLETTNSTFLEIDRTCDLRVTGANNETEVVKRVCCGGTTVARVLEKAYLACFKSHNITEAQWLTAINGTTYC